jgi:hypothetical protein
MAITKVGPDKGTLFDSILNKREAFLKTDKPEEQAFPPIFDLNVIEQLQTQTVRKAPDVKLASGTPKKSTDGGAGAASGARSLLPKVTSEAANAPQKQAESPNAYSYLGATARKNVLWEDLLPSEAMSDEQLEEARNTQAVAQAKAKARRSGGGAKRELDQRSKVIVKALPKPMRPMQTCTDFPHIMNLIAASWHEPKAFVKTLDELLMDDRGDRQGFPFPIIVELTELREYYFTSVRPEALKFWKRL